MNHQAFSYFKEIFSIKNLIPGGISSNFKPLTPNRLRQPTSNLKP
jgi:hypothetical protein